MSRPVAAGAAPRRPPWPAAVGGLLAGAVGLGVVLAGVGTAEHVLVGGETRQWCEGSPGYDSPTGGELERCVREREDRHLVAPDQHRIEFYRADSDGLRYEPHPWPLDGDEVRVDFGEDGVTVTDDHGIAATYPNSVFDDAR